VVIVGEKIIELAVKVIAKKFKLTKILEYVEKPNVLDESVDRLYNITQALASRVSHLESDSHPKRDFVVCEKCKSEVEEKKGKWYDK
jgi:uncharacterized protein YoxC